MSALLALPADRRNNGDAAESGAVYGGDFRCYLQNNKAFWAEARRLDQKTAFSALQSPCRKLLYKNTQIVYVWGRNAAIPITQLHSME